MHKQTELTKCSSAPPSPPPLTPLPRPLCPPPPFLSCFVESKEKGLKIRRYPEGWRSPSSQALTFKDGGQMTDCKTWGITDSHIFVLFVVI